MTTRMPAACSAASAAGVVALIGIGDGDDAGGRAVDGDEDDGGAVAGAARSAARGERTGVDARLGHDALVADDEPPASTEPVTPLPTGCVEIGRRRPAAARAPRRRARWRRPADARCRAPGWRPAAAARPRSTGRRPDGHHLGPALGQRAGLVDDQGVDLLQALQRLGVLDQHAGCAPRPTPTMIDIGVASPSAHGQAMISTDTAAIRP